MDKPNVLILTQNNLLTNILYNAICSQCNVEAVIIENPVDRKSFLTRRIKKLGLITVLGQVLFVVLVVPFLKLSSSKRIEDIIKNYQLNTNNIPDTKTIKVSSINSTESHKAINSFNVDIILVNGTRIISSKTIKKCKAPLVNFHAGITPKYRGVHGGYWALVNNDVKNFGATLHFIDEGIDTGSIIGQQFVLPANNDNFYTYPFLQLAISIKSLIEIIKNHKNISTKHTNFESKIWSHPTIWSYLYHRFFKQVK